MPEGIIRDPKQNPVEKEFGIIYIEDLDHHHFIYRKKVNDQHRTRLFVAGTVVDITVDEKKNKIDYFDFPILVDGIICYGEFKNPEFRDITAKDNAPVIFHLRNNGYQTLREEQINQWIDELDNYTSELHNQ